MKTEQERLNVCVCYGEKVCFYINQNSISFFFSIFPFVAFLINYLASLPSCQVRSLFSSLLYVGNISYIAAFCTF